MNGDVETPEEKPLNSNNEEQLQDVEEKERSNFDDSALDPNETPDCSESSNEDSISNSESLKTEDTDGSLTEKLRETIAYQQTIIQENSEKLRNLEPNYIKIQQHAKELEAKLDIANAKKDAALKDKESMVVRYAMSEKNVLKEKKLREASEKKLAEANKELEILQHRIQTLITEKSRICQMLDNKIYDNKLIQQELNQRKQDLTALENKLKWSQTSLKTEIDSHKETQVKLEHLTSKYQEISNSIEQIKREAEESVKAYHTSEENRAHVLEQQVNERQATLILLKHQKKDRDEQLEIHKNQLERLQAKQKEMLHENNNLYLKVQQLEKDRSENELKLSELRGCADQQRQDVADLQTKSVHLEQLKLQLKHEQDQLAACNEQMSLLKQRNCELESDMESCRVREAELLLFTQQLTEKNVRLQSEFTSMETRVQQLSCEQTLMKRQIKEQEAKANMLSIKLKEERQKYQDDTVDLKKKLKDITKTCEEYKQEATDQKSENILIKRKFDMSLREVNKELQHHHKRLEKFENVDKSSPTSTSSSNSSLVERSIDRPNSEIDQQTLLEHIVKLQKISAKKSEKIDFLEEHVNSLVSELQKKSKMLQGYVMREQKSIHSNRNSNKKESTKVGKSI